MGAAIAAAVVLMACSAAPAASPTTSSPAVTICDPGSAAPQSPDDLPAVGDIAAAVAELRVALGLEPEFFEINATADLVNLFVALNGGTAVQPWLFAAGTLTAEEVQPASGGTFGAASLDVEPTKVFDGVRREIPDAVVETFYVHGDGRGNVQYGLLVSTVCGGGFDVTVSSTGAIRSVDPT